MTTLETTIATSSSLGYIPELTCSVSVRNLEQAKTWYQDILGFTHLYTMPQIAWAELSTAIPGVNIGLSEVEQVEPKGSVVLVFGVKDIVHARTRLEAKHVRFDGPTSTIESMVKLATFYDSDGNPFMLSEAIPSKN
jgi:CreA protein